MYKKWIKLREASKDEYGDKICYCGHTDMCSCSNPDKTLFKESINRGVLNPNDINNGWNNKYEE